MIMLLLGVRMVIDMSRLLNDVILPGATGKNLHTKNDDTLARIRLLMKALQMQEARILPLVSEATVKEIDESFEHLQEADILRSAQIHIMEEAAISEVPQYLTVREVSRLTGLVPQVVRRHLTKGKFKGEQVAGENSTWRVFPEQFMQYSNWEAFLKEREKERQNSIKLIKLGLELWDSDEGPVDAGTK